MTLGQRGHPMKRTGIARGPGPKRKTGLQQRRHIANVTELRPGDLDRAGADDIPFPSPGGASRAVPSRPVPASAPTPAVRQLCWKRDRGRCVRCGISLHGIRSNLHHRRDRGSGGSSLPWISTPINLISLCGSGTTGCHGWVTENRNRKQALAAGWIVRKNGQASVTDPALIPVRVHWLKGLHYATPDGRWRPAPPAPHPDERLVA